MNGWLKKVLHIINKQLLINKLIFIDYIYYIRCHRGRDRMVVGFTTTYTIGAYNH